MQQGRIDCPGAALPRRPTPLRDIVLGTHPRVRKRMFALSLCMLVYAVSCALAFVATDMGFIRAGFAPWLTACTVVQLGVFYGLLRSGWSLRLRDPGMIFAQNIVAVASIAFAYAMMSPEHRGLVLMLVGMVVQFGLYSLTPRQALAIGACTALFLGPVMLVLPGIDPQWFHRDLERVRFELLAGTLPALSLSARYIALWRDRVVSQKKEIQLALARVQELATRDRLTGLVNRRHMQELLEQTCSQADPGSFCLALIDLDHFKRINDSHGHRVGDQVLRGFAQACASVLRSQDVVARWGGEEFLILLPQARAQQTRAALERLNARLLHQQVSEAVPQLRVAFSAGVAEFKRSETLAQALERADRALYVAKSQGRQRSQVARQTTLLDAHSDLVDAH